jgi:hypothetical protein
MSESAATLTPLGSPSRRMVKTTKKFYFPTFSHLSFFGKLKVLNFRVSACEL